MKNSIIIILLLLTNLLLAQVKQTEIPVEIIVTQESPTVLQSSKYASGIFQLGFRPVDNDINHFSIEIKNIEDERYTLRLNEKSIIDYNFFTCMLPEGIYHISLESSEPISLKINQFIYFVVDDSRSICGTDNRTLSSSAKCGRVMPTGCTAQLLSNGTLTMSGHCLYQFGTGVYNFSANSFVHFNVPLSSPSGSPIAPPVEDQYPVSIASITHEYPFPSTCGRDWCIFQINPNANTGLTAFEVQNDFYYVTSVSPTTSFDIMITGYGTDSNNPTWSQVQQSHSGDNNGIETLSTGGIIISYEADTEGGNSGSAIQRIGNLDFSYGIHNSGGCGASGCSGNGDNSGISFSYDNLEDAMNDYYGNTSVHVSKVSNSIFESGTAFQPYDTMEEGQTASSAISENTVILMSGTYNETNDYLLTKPMLIISPAGSSIIK